MFVKVTKGQAAPITLTEFRKMYWETSFPQDMPPAMMAEKGVYPARDMDRPTLDANQRATLSEDFTQVGGDWVREWVVQTLTQDEIRAGMVCTRLQGRLALGEAEIARLDAFIDGLPENWTVRYDNWSLRQVVDNAVTWRRTSQDMVMLGFALNYTPERMDETFIRAIAIEI